MGKLYYLNDYRYLFKKRCRHCNRVYKVMDFNISAFCSKKCESKYKRCKICLDLMPMKKGDHCDECLITKRLQEKES